nr:hypothetical protein [Crucivirus sp.]
MTYCVNMAKKTPTRSKTTGGSSTFSFKEFLDTEAVVSKPASGGTIKSRVAYKKKQVVQKNTLVNRQKELNKRYATFGESCSMRHTSLLFPSMSHGARSHCVAMAPIAPLRGVGG